MNVLVSQMLTMTLLVVTMVVCLVHPASGRGVWEVIRNTFFQKNYEDRYQTVIKQFDDRFVRGFHPMNKPHPS